MHLMFCVLTDKSSNVDIMLRKPSFQQYVACDSQILKASIKEQWMNFCSVY